MSINIHSNNPRVQLKQVISNYLLEESAKKLWNACIDNISDDDAKSILEVLKDDAKNLEFLTKNLEDKIKAIKAKDRGVWQKIIKEEKNFVDEK